MQAWFHVWAARNLKVRTVDEGEGSGLEWEHDMLFC